MIYHAKLAVAMLVIVASFGMLVSAAFIVPALTFSGVLATLIVTHRTQR